ncbi:M15 family metallopeptidase [Yanghanlia caeni]|uniref:D-alanyl-D-alanine dipeptidase n=1 Tax=Yanghanlia caeni TaxID=3064283 RepID=A0ABU1D8G7_9BURK|nr:M15 family metallopeptidase [Alcaligenaceae bacterium LG-2]
MKLSLKLHRITALLPALLLAVALPAHALPDDFVYVAEVVPNVVIDARYAGDNNFVGRPVDGYLANTVILTRPAAEALAKVSEDLAAFGLGLKVFDGFRPQRAVDHFVRWAADLSDQSTKARHYPDVEKEHLFRDGYIAERSGHSRGSTVDLTIIDLATGEELPMGTPFDYFGLESWPSYTKLPAEQRAFRALLQQVMTRHGFRPLNEEWWHFTLENEPYPETYFDFPVE